MVQRLRYRRRQPYNTKSNKVKVSKTPGGRLVYLPRKKLGKRPASKEAMNGYKKVRLHGIPAVRPYQLKRMSKCQKKVNRAYGGCLDHKSLRNRIIQAFLVEEQKVVQKLCKARNKK